MTDIADWLRAYANRTTVIDVKRLDEAADEIERLRAALEQIAKYSADENEMDWADTVLAMNAIARAALEEGRT